MQSIPSDINTLFNELLIKAKAAPVAHLNTTHALGNGWGVEFFQGAVEGKKTLACTLWLKTELQTTKQLAYLPAPPQLPAVIEKMWEAHKAFQQ